MSVLLRRLACPSGVIGAYLHAGPGQGLGKMGALVALADRGGTQLEGRTAEKAQVGGALAPCFGACMHLADRPATMLQASPAACFLISDLLVPWCMVVSDVLARGAVMLLAWK